MVDKFDQKMTQLANNIRSVLNLEGKLTLMGMINGYKKAMTPNLYYGEKTVVLDKDLGNFNIDGNETILKLDKPLTRRGKIEVKANYEIRHHESDFLKDWRPKNYFDSFVWPADTEQRFSLDSVKYNSGILTVDGWALDPKMTDYKYHFIFLFNKTRNVEMARTTIVNSERGDVYNAYPNYKCGIYSGIKAQFLTKDESYYNDEIQIISRFTNDPNGDDPERSDYWGPSFRYESSKGNKKIVTFKEYKEPIALEYNFTPDGVYYPVSLNDQRTVLDGDLCNYINDLDVIDNVFSKINELTILGIRQLKRKVGSYEAQRLRLIITFSPIENIDSTHIRSDTFNDFSSFKFNNHSFILEVDLSVQSKVSEFHISGTFKIGKIPENKIYDNTRMKVYLKNDKERIDLGNTKFNDGFAIYREGQTISFSIWGKQENLHLGDYKYVIEVDNSDFDSSITLENQNCTFLKICNGYLDSYENINEGINCYYRTLSVLIQNYHKGLYIIPTSISIDKMIEITNPETKDG